MKYLVDFSVLILLYMFRFYRRWKTEGKDVLLVKTLMYIYLSLVLFFTLMPVITSLPFIFTNGYEMMNLVPFIDILEGRGDFLRQVLLNVIMTIPFGFLFPLTKKNGGKFSTTVFYCFLLSLGIELMQPLINDWRSSDITDIITNVLGGMIGYGFYKVFKPLVIKILNHIKS